MLSIDRKTKIHQENKYIGRLHTVHILPKCRKTGNFNLFEPILAIIAEDDKKISKRVIRIMYQILTTKPKWT